MVTCGTYRIPVSGQAKTDRLDDGDVAGGEAGFAVFQVVVPGADEGLVEAEGATDREYSSVTRNHVGWSISDWSPGGSSIQSSG
jgi:hypothetical protein